MLNDIGCGLIIVSVPPEIHAACPLQGVCWLLAVTAVVAAIGLGGGGVSVVGQRVRSGFVQAMGAHISGTPAN